MNRKKLIAWYLYDFGMASFTMVVVTAFYVLYFKRVVVGGPRGDLLWGASISITMIMVALLSPFLGAVADFAGRKRFFLVAFAGTSIASTAALSLVGPGMVLPGMLLFITGYLGYTGAMPFYNGIMTDIAPRESWPRVSGIGWGLGYIGGLTALLMIKPFARDALLPEGVGNARIILLATAAFYLAFALPAFILLGDIKKGDSGSSSYSDYLRAGFSRLSETFRTARGNRDLWIFLLSFFLFNDAITTVITFFSVYATDTLGFSMTENIYLLITVQVTAAIGAFLSGPLARRMGLIRTISATLLVWIAAVMGAFFAQSKGHFWIVSVAAGTVLGATQASARTLVAELAPGEKRSEIFGFMAVCGKLAAVVGPLVFGIISSMGGGQRWAILSVEIFFVAGLVLLLRVRSRA
jgi:UMF1 family MFS transporter